MKSSAISLPVSPKIDFDTIFPDVREAGGTWLQQSHLVMLRMLKIFDYLCARHNIQYFLVGGSLLGAIRHNGFIPWDDDLDIGMTRSNYEKFLQFAVSELPYDIFFQNTETDKCLPHCKWSEARLRDKYSSYTHLNSIQNKWHEGLQVDIFVYDRAFLPHNFFIVMMNQFSYTVIKNTGKRARILKWIEKNSPFPLVYASNYLTGLKTIRFGTNFIRKSEISKLEQVNFEDMKVWIPEGWDACLKRQYGNYMQLPSPEKRFSHHNVTADPFTSCQHDEVLSWTNRKK